MKNFRDLDVWRKAHLLTLDIYQVTGPFPKEELYGLTGQIRRSASSIAANIAEGCGRGTDTDFARFLQIAMGSASEAEYQLLLSHDLKFINTAEFKKLDENIAEVKRMLASLIKRVRYSKPEAAGKS